MEEIAGFTGSDAERDMYEAIAALYERLAQDQAGAKDEIVALAGFFPASETELIMPDLVSYSQRFEDLYLGCCFPDKHDGFYIDIGAGHPVYDNVSFASYLQRLARDRGRAQSVAVATRSRRSSARQKYPGSCQRSRGKRRLSSRQRISRPVDDDRGSRTQSGKRIRQGVANAHHAGDDAQGAMRTARAEILRISQDRCRRRRGRRDPRRRLEQRPAEGRS